MRSVTVRIFGVPIAGCKPGRAWQDAANFVRTQLKSKFSDQINLEYVDFLPSRWQEFPKILDLIEREGAQIPIVMVNDEVVSVGGKISISKIARKIEQLGIKPL